MACDDKDGNGEHDGGADAGFHLGEGEVGTRGGIHLEGLSGGETGSSSLGVNEGKSIEEGAAGTGILMGTVFLVALLLSCKRDLSQRGVLVVERDVVFGGLL